MKKSVNRKIGFTLFLSFIMTVNVHAESLINKYMREHSFKPIAESEFINKILSKEKVPSFPYEYDFYSIRPEHQFHFQEKMELILDRYKIDNAFQMQLDSILQGGEVDSVFDTDVWWMLRGGELTGNGGGIVEAKFEYHYDRLGKYILHCIRSNSACSMSEEDVLILENIKNIVAEKRTDPTRLVFMSGNENPKFFEENKGPWGVRTAKTGNSPSVPIFINTDHLYLNNIPSLNDDEIITMIIHETGHQANIQDHAYLNRLGSELVKFLKKKSASVKRKHRNVFHQVDLTNFEASHQDAEATLTYAGEQIDLRPLIKDSLSCPHPDQRVIGFQLTNPFWKRESQKNGLENFPMGLWAQVNCKFMHQRIVYKIDLDVTLHFLFSEVNKRQLQEVHVELNK